MTSGSANLDAVLAELLDEAAASTRASERVRERWLAQQDEATATLAGTLLDLAEGDVDLSIRIDGGRRVEGRPVAVGLDVVVLHDRGAHVAVSLPSAITVRPVPDAMVAPARGSRRAPLDLTFGELLARLADSRPEVAVGLRSGELISGILLAVGADVLTLRIAPGAGGLVYASLGAASSVRFRSG